MRGLVALQGIITESSATALASIADIRRVCVPFSGMCGMRASPRRFPEIGAEAVPSSIQSTRPVEYLQ